MATKVYDRTKQRITSSGSSSSIGDDDDLVVEILIRLPNSKSAFRCKPVCKGWNSLISNPYFSRRFVSHHQTLSAADESDRPPFLTDSQVRESILSFLPLPPNTRESILDSFNDLFLLGFRSTTKNDGPELGRTYLVCNSFTKQWVALPLAPETTVRDSRFIWVVKLVCEPPPVNSPHGAQVFPCRFQVVRMYGPASSASSEIEVYKFCSSSGRWTKLVLRLDDADLRCDLSYRVVSANGKLYWLNELRRGLVKWDLYGGGYGRLPILYDRGSKSKLSTYGPWVSEGALHVIDMLRTAGSVYMVVWRLNEEGEGGNWRKMYEVENLSCRSVILATDTLDLDYLSVIGLHPLKSEIVFLEGFRTYGHRSVRIFYGGRAIVSWDFRKRRFEFLAYPNEEGSPCLARGNDMVFRSRVAFWPSLIPNYEELRNNYNGSYNCWHVPS